jgi:hypothetical protein
MTLLGMNSATNIRRTVSATPAAAVIAAPG